MTKPRTPRTVKHLGLRVVDDEPEERPSRLGADLLRVQVDYPGKWIDVIESPSRELVRDQCARLNGTAQGRIAGILSTDGWEARLTEGVLDGEQSWIMRVRYTPPSGEPTPDERPADTAGDHEIAVSGEVTPEKVETVTDRIARGR